MFVLKRNFFKIALSVGRGVVSVDGCREGGAKIGIAPLGASSMRTPSLATSQLAAGVLVEVWVSLARLGPGVFPPEPSSVAGMYETHLAIQ